MRRQMREIHDALALARKDHTATLVRLTKIAAVDLAAAVSRDGPLGSYLRDCGAVRLLGGILPGESGVGRRLL